jgi:hypothetical protein
MEVHILSMVTNPLIKKYRYDNWRTGIMWRFLMKGRGYGKIVTMEIIYLSYNKTAILVWVHKCKRKPSVSFPCWKSNLFHLKDIIMH